LTRLKDSGEGHAYPIHLRVNVHSPNFPVDHTHCIEIGLEPDIVEMLRTAN
jgi:hypothetical protein